MAPFVPPDYCLPYAITCLRWWNDGNAIVHTWLNEYLERHEQAGVFSVDVPLGDFSHFLKCHHGLAAAWDQLCTLGAVGRHTTPCFAICVAVHEKESGELLPNFVPVMGWCPVWHQGLDPDTAKFPEDSPLSVWSFMEKAEWPGPFRDDLFRFQEGHLLGGRTAFERLIAALTPADADGPVSSTSFRLNGLLIEDLTAKQMDLLRCLWGDGTFPVVPRRAACTALYGSDQPQRYETVDSHRKTLKRKLFEQSNGAWEIPFKQKAYRLTYLPSRGQKNG